ncbi:MAG: hypothetical protein R3F20_03150 [Planctomycetota bacterium]
MNPRSLDVLRRSLGGAALIAVLALPLSAQCGGGTATGETKGACGTAGACGESCESGTDFLAIAKKARRAPCATMARTDVFNSVPGLADLDEAEALVALLREADDEEAAAKLLADRARPAAPVLDAETARELARRVRAPGCSSGGRNLLFQELAAVAELGDAEALAARVREADDLDAAAAVVLAAARDRDDRTIDAKRALELAEQVRAPGCSSGGRNLLFQTLDACPTLDEAEALAARVREARDLRAAAGEILFAVATAPKKGATVAFPPMLSETGFFRDLAKREMAADFISYEVNSGLWSDGAIKDRFLRLPKGEAIRYREDGGWIFPRGTTFLQTLRFSDADEDDLVVETRVIRKDGDDLSFGVYVWNDEGTDARLVRNGDEFYANHGQESQLWNIARERDCTKCHNEATGRILGVTTAQLNRARREADAPNQLQAMAKLGHLQGLPADVAALPALADPRDASAPLEARARSYLHVHCASCHQPGGPGSGTMDLRLDTPFEDTGIFASKSHELRRGVAVPGRPRHSRFIQRMGSVGWDRMPSLLSTVPDEEGIRMLSEWIASKGDVGRNDAR